MTGGKGLTTYRILSDPWIREHLRPYRRYFVQIMTIMAATICINFAIPLTSRAVVNTGILNNDPWFVDLILGLQAAMYLALILLNTIRSKISAHVSNRLVTRMTSEHVGQVIALPMSFFHSSKSGEIVERVRDLERVQRFASVEMVDALAAAISILSLSLLLLWIDFTIFLIFATSALSYLAWIHIVGSRRRQIDVDRFRESARSRAIEIGIVDGMQDIKIAGHEQASLATWASVQLEALRTRLKSASIEQLQATGGHLFTRAGMVLVTFASAKKAIAGEITLGDFTITSVIIVQLYFHLNQLLEFVNKLEDVRAALHRAQQVRDIEPERGGTHGTAKVPAAWQPIVLDKVAFSYPGASRPSLASISFSASAGTMTALIGPSGSGKSTILKLLLRLYEPTAGTITVGGVPLADIDHAHWRDRIGAVMQEGALFAATIRENILAGRAADEGWLTEVLAAACLADVVRDADDGLDTLVGPSGARLSAGQVQRILIGRALYKRPSLLLLDEATSALDGRNETSVVRNIRDLLPEVTSIVAAHRLNTIRDAEQVIAIDGGQVLEIGSPRALLDVNAAQLGLAR